MEEYKFRTYIDPHTPTIFLHKKIVKKVNKILGDQLSAYVMFRHMHWVLNID